MKKTLFASAMLLAFSFHSNAQSDDAKTNVVKLNPLGALFGAANLSYEKALSDKNSVVISPSFGFLKTGGVKYTSFGLGGEYRFYFSRTKSAPAGMYAAPGAGFSLGTAKDEDPEGGNEKTNISSFNVKAIIGHQWIWDGGFTLDLNGGLQYLGYTFKDNSGSFANVSAFNGILPALAVSIGYNF